MKVEGQAAIYAMFAEQQLGLVEIQLLLAVESQESGQCQDELTRMHMSIKAILAKLQVMTGVQDERS